MLRRGVAIFLMLAISVAAFASHCEEFYLLTEHLAAAGNSSAAAALQSPTDGHEEPCDHCAFCTGGIDLERPTALPEPTIAAHQATHAKPQTQSPSQLPAIRPPRA